jgi:hypothetical protein
MTCLSRLTSIEHRQRVHPVQVQAGSRPTRLPGTGLLLAGTPEVLQWQRRVKMGGAWKGQELRDFAVKSPLFDPWMRLMSKADHLIIGH